MKPKLAEKPFSVRAVWPDRTRRKIARDGSGNKRIKLCLFTFLAITTGCQSLTRSPGRIHAKQQWNRVRADLKEQLARQHYEQGRFEEAIRTAREVIELDPQSEQAHLLLARSLLQLGKTGSGQRALDRARRAGVDNADLDYLQGIIFEYDGRLAQALSAYRKARERDPQQADYLIAEVETLVSLGRPTEALDLLRPFQNRPSDDATLTALTAHILAMTGDDEGALRYYRRASTDPDASRVMAEELGTRLARAGRCAEAVTVLTPLVESVPDEELPVGVFQAMGACQLSLDDAASAKRILEDHAARLKEDGTTQLLLSKAALLEGDLPTALSAVDRAGRLKPDDPDLLLIRAAALWKRGRPRAAAADLQKLLQKRPDDIDARCLLGEVLVARGRVVEAEAQFREVLSRDPGSAWARAAIEALARRRSNEKKDPSPVLTSRSAN